MPKKKTGRWFKGDVFSMSSNNFEQTRKKYEKDVMKPTALRTKKTKKGTFSQFYYKPIKPGEMY